jgi:pimeloyl-ACP methyl ester carboxylesterase
MNQGPAGHVTRSFNRPLPETAPRAERRTFLRTVDGVTIDALYEPGKGTSASPSELSGDLSGDHPSDLSGELSGEFAIVVAHGFTGDLDRPHVRRVAGLLAEHAAVVTFSFRGHGASGGLSTVGDREVLDLAAAVAWARELGHTRVATVGFSMGGSVVLRHAAMHRRGPAHEPAQERAGRTGAYTDAVVSVSAPARWYYRGTKPMRRLHWVVTRPLGRTISRYGLRTRIHHRDWDPVPLSPVESVPLIAPTPLLIVHGEIDGYFPLDHPRMLAAAGEGHAELWLEAGMGHAEHAADDALLGRIGAWAASAAG